MNSYEDDYARPMPRTRFLPNTRTVLISAREQMGCLSLLQQVVREHSESWGGKWIEPLILSITPPRLSDDSRIWEMTVTLEI